MRIQRRISCGAIALMLCTSLLTACGQETVTTEERHAAEEQTASETTASEQETTNTTETTAEAKKPQTTAEAETANLQETADPDVDMDAAYEAADRFLRACVDGDVDEIYARTNIGTLIDTATEIYGEASEENEEILQEALDTLATLESYTLSAGYTDSDLLALYAEYVAEIQAEADEALADASEEYVEEISIMMAMFQPIDALCLFDFTYIENGVEKSDTLYVILQNGEWKVDCVVLPLTVSMVGYVKKSKLTSCNMYAKSLYNAANTALLEMDVEGYDSTLLSGNYTFTGSDFENVTKPESVTNGNEAYTMLKSRISVYFDSVTELEAIAITIQDGACTAVAVRNGTMEDILNSGTLDVYGCYPNPLTQDDLEQYQDLADVLVYANE